MGVLYHQRDPSRHIRDLWSATIPGDTLVLETISAEHEFSPDSRYAGMRNVWHIPSQDSACALLSNAGFDNIVVVDQTRTCHRDTLDAVVDFEYNLRHAGWSSSFLL